MDAQECKQKPVVVEFRRFGLSGDADVQIGAWPGRAKMVAVDQELGERTADATGGDQSRHVHAHAKSRDVFEAEPLFEEGRPGDGGSRATGQRHRSGDDAEIRIVIESSRDSDSDDVLQDDEDASERDQD